MAQEKTPGVYIKELPAFPNSVVEVPTAVPVFIGYTERAMRGTTNVTNMPIRLTSMAEYMKIFGMGPTPEYTFAVDDAGKITLTAEANSLYNLFNGMRLFFDNGGGPCWIVSIGNYSGDEKAADAFGDKVWAALKKEPEPTMVVIPDSVLMPSEAEYKKIWDKAFPHCIAMQNRIAILDVFNGFKPRNSDDGIDVISDEKVGFRQLIEYDNMSYGAAYYPFVNTNLFGPTDVNYLNITKDSRKDLADHITKEFSGAADKVVKAIKAYLDTMNGDDTSDGVVTKTHQALASISETYKQAMLDLMDAMNLQPPSAAMAGVYTRTDNEIGVFKAPANTGIMDVMSPAVSISDEEQQDLNVPLDGKAINAIRSFLGRGVLVWGARTLDGNSQDYRYINVRRTLIMLEQSIATAAESYVFASNDANTWLTVRTMIENFLNNQWKSGALAGATPAEAYQVDVGLGSTMTGNDILDGYMRVSVKVAIVRPAEFIVITFQQKMQTS
ncbi:phage tail sheath C-terminal domain-containing protein [Dinoroseobacter sp. PD6]|uniref:phage tail sheath family protein n=1 Tax=Dinoroseobacter sp. PD6 TaxID=3028384 RepID=UPI00237C33D9|nr:phage tail sheath C-terminal domain-containing protein [Dinoroseobacter sp. PD6]MDD9716283.1 phage tail sheath C-terminal domain-containing protein [Dinoroseobacter sp. PD6]